MMELTSYHKESYGLRHCARPPDPSRCAEEVLDQRPFSHFWQCSRKRGYGPEGAYCKQHDPAAKAERARKRRLKYEVGSWQRYGRDCAKAAIGNAAIAFFSQRGTLEDVEKAVDEYLRKEQEMASLLQARKDTNDNE